MIHVLAIIFAAIIASFSHAYEYPVDANEYEEGTAEQGNHDGLEGGAELEKVRASMGSGQMGGGGGGFGGRGFSGFGRGFGGGGGGGGFGPSFGQFPQGGTPSMKVRMFPPQYYYYPGMQQDPPRTITIPGVAPMQFPQGHQQPSGDPNQPSYRVFPPKYYQY